MFPNGENKLESIDRWLQNYVAVAYMIEARTWLQIENVRTTTFTSLAITQRFGHIFCTFKNTS
jgi:hypothetical protein